VLNQLSEFEREFLSGFAWLVLRRLAVFEMNERGIVVSMAVSSHITDEQMRAFPRAAHLALVAFHDSMNEVKCQAGGTGMNQLYNVLEKYVPAGAFLLAVSRVTEESEHVTE
jgi:hypothetical protein